MYKKLLLGAILLGISYLGYSQQNAQFSQYYLNPLYVNPAYAGSREMLTAILQYRQQWVGISGAPVSQTFTMHGPLKGKNASLGAKIYNDEVGPLRNTGFSGIYSYKVPFSKGDLSFGLEGSVRQFNFLFDKFDVEIVSEVAQGVTTIPKTLVADAGFGMYYQSDNFYIGGSILNLIQSRLNNTNVHVPNTINYYGFTGYATPISKSGLLVFKPSLLTKIVEANPIDFDASALFTYDDKVSAGLTYRTSSKKGVAAFDNSIIFLFELYLTDHFRFGYSYDYDMNELSNHSSGSHEFMLGYDFRLLKTKVSSPRQF